MVCHGANPGLVSHFVKAALRDLADALGLQVQAPAGAAGWAELAERTVTVSEYLTRYREDGTASYRPTVVFSYLPCDAAFASLHESVMRDWQAPDSARILNQDIVEGRDELGVLLLEHPLGGWWYGSQLDIHEARRLVRDNNPTAIQVAAGVLAALLFIIDHPRCGYLEPEALPHERVLEVARPYLGPMVSTPTDWTPLSQRQRFFDEPGLVPADPWQFGNFYLG